LCDAIDVPGWLSNEASKQKKKSLTTLPIPGKIFQFLFQGIPKSSHWSLEGRAQGGSKERTWVVAFEPDQLPEGMKRRKNGMEVYEEKTRVTSTATEGDNANGPTTVRAKAVKLDDAQVPIHLWNERILEGLEEEQKRACTKDSKTLKRFENLLDWLRRKCLKRWKRSVIN